MFPSSLNSHSLQRIQQKRPFRAFFLRKPNSLGQPGLNGGGAVLSFPFLQRLVIAAFGFDDFAGVRIFVDLHFCLLYTSDAADE